MRITVTLDDETHERLVEWATADRRSVASTAAMLIEFALTNDENALLNVPPGVRGHGIRTPDLTEEGRRLASQRDTLIAAGVPPTELAVPLAPTRSTRGGGTSSKPVTELAQPPHGPAPGAVCTHPKNRRQVFGWGTLCDACGKRL
jgi:CopG-like RHH_1 or ribbon-helix-helix domain, RHH_5